MTHFKYTFIFPEVKDPFQTMILSGNKMCTHTHTHTHTNKHYLNCPCSVIHSSTSCSLCYVNCQTSGHTYWSTQHASLSATIQDGGQIGHIPQHHALIESLRTQRTDPGVLLCTQSLNENIHWTNVQVK